MTLSTPAFASRAPSSRPAGPAPTIATCVRRGAVTSRSPPAAGRASGRAARPRGRASACRGGADRRRAGRPSSITAATVCSSGRVTRRVCSARCRSTREWPRFSGSSEGSQSGSSLHGSTPSASRNFSATGTGSAGGAPRFSASSWQTAISSLQLHGGPFAGPVPLKAPRSPRSTRRTIQAARSRTSMNCSGSSSPRSGTSISPPSSARHGQWLKRPLRSPGPTIRPGRTISARSPNTFCTSASQAAFCGP